MVHSYSTSIQKVEARGSDYKVILRHIASLSLSWGKKGNELEAAGHVLSHSYKDTLETLPGHPVLYAFLSYLPETTYS